MIIRKGTQTICGVCGGAKHQYPSGKYRCHTCKVKQQKNWRKTVKGKVYSKRHGTSINYKYSQLKHVANKHGIELHLSKEQFKQIHADPCFYCGFALPQYGYGLDRKDCSLGYDVENAVACCNECNKAKLNLFSAMEMQIIGAAIRQVKMTRLMKACETEGGAGWRR